ncbi:MAG: ABC transporter ATP-binding protein [Acidimicrobiia bacterium]
MADPAAELRSIDKAFFGVKANDAVDFDLRWGEVHALLGENGAGKSTLCSVLAGLYRPDAGRVLIEGRGVDLRSPADALALGVGMVYQHFRLVRPFTVAENLALGHPEAGLRLSRRRIEREAAGLADRYGLAVDPRARIWQLSVGEQQRVEILKLVYRRVRILIMDEPTAVLTPQEAEALFRTIRLMAGEGKAVVFVSHKLDEVLRVSDRITVLRDGRRVGAMPTQEAEARTLARLMVGRDLDLPERESVARPGRVMLEVSGLHVRGDRGHLSVRGVDLAVREGEIVGVAGVAGNGQRELADALAGLRRASAGRVVLDGDDLTRAAPAQRIQAGLGFVPEDRLGIGLAPGLTVQENLALKSYRRPPLASGPLLAEAVMRRRAADLISRFDIRGTRPGLPVRLLSGGNLQRVLLAREISARPKFLLAASPTRGLDVGATQAVRALLLEQREEGVAVLLLSEDLDELLALSDRILVMYEGRMVGEVDAAADPEELGLLMAGRALPTEPVLPTPSPREGEPGLPPSGGEGEPGLPPSGGEGEPGLPPPGGEGWGGGPP